MGYKITNDLEKLHPVLTEFGLDWNDFAVLNAIGGRQNDAALARVLTGEISDRSEEGLESWSWASVKRIHLDKCVKLRTVGRSLATLLAGGFIETLPPAKDNRVYRRVNQSKLKVMLAAVPARLKANDIIMYRSGERRSKSISPTVIDVEPVEEVPAHTAEPVPPAAIKLAKPVVATAMKPIVTESPAASAFPTEPTPGMSQAEELSILFFNCLERPKTHNTEGFRVESVRRFGELLIAGDYTSDELKGSMRWAFDVSTYWPPILMKQTKPLTFFLNQLDKHIIGQYRGIKKAEANATKQAQAVPITTATSTAAKPSVDEWLVRTRLANLPTQKSLEAA